MSDDGYFAHKYWSDGSPGSSWHALIDDAGQQQLPIQIDETALVLYALWKHFEKYQDVEFISKVYPKLVIKTADFLKNYISPETGLPRPSFDIWEEKGRNFYRHYCLRLCGTVCCSQLCRGFLRQKTSNGTEQSCRPNKGRNPQTSLR